MNKNTSFEFSKKLWKNGCKLESNYWPLNCFPSYDILWDICVKYSKEFFGDEIYHDEICVNRGWIIATIDIFKMLTKNEKTENIEKYIWENCKFNPKNK